MKRSIIILLFGLLLTNINVYINKEDNKSNTNNTNVEEKIKDKEKRNSAYLDDTFLTNDATYYYYNLTENYPKNYKGTCSYVAISMLLQYYDTFWDDNIISPYYDVAPTNTISINERTSSPGVKADKISGYTDEQASKLTNLEYYDLVMGMTNKYFQPYLFKIADEDLGLVTMPSEDCFASLSAEGTQLFLDHYFQNYVGYSTGDYTLTVYNNDYDFSKSEEVKSYIVNKVKQGIPVLISISTVDELHACIAYDYDISTDTIYLHYGNYAGDVHINADMLESIVYLSATTLEIHKAHSHSNNYGLVTNGNVTYHCGCELSTHKHSYTASYAQYSDTYHTEYCHCGASKQNLHECTGLYGRYEACIHCGTVVDLWYIGTNNIILPKEEEEVI